VISILTVFVNKTLLSVDQLDVDAPIFIAWFQCLVSAIICFTLSRLSKLFPKVVQFPEGNPFNPLTVRNVSYLGCTDELLKYKKQTKHFIWHDID